MWASITGLIQQVKYNPFLDVTFFWIGPSIQNTTLLYVLRESGEDQGIADTKTAMADGLTAAMFAGRQVTVDYENQVILRATVQAS
jgi:hypothetical protein